MQVADAHNDLLLAVLHQGVRCMSLTWNRRTMLADGVGETEAARKVASDNWIDLLGRVLPSGSHRTRRK